VRRRDGDEKEMAGLALVLSEKEFLGQRPQSQRTKVSFFDDSIATQLEVE